MYPTRRALILFGAGVPVGVVCVLWGLPLVPVLWLLASLGLLAADLLLAPQAHRFDLSLREPPLLYAGGSDPLVLDIGIDSLRRPVAVDAWLDADDHLEPLPAASLLVEPGAAVRCAFELTPRRRGAAAIDTLTLRWRGPLGLMARQIDHRVDLRIAISPNVRAVRQAALEFFARDARLGLKAQLEAGSGSDFHSVRDYVTGMEHRFIDWKRSARHRRLQAREFRTERNHQIYLTLDTGHLMAEPLGGLSRLDHAVNAALMMAYVSLRSGDRVGVVGFDSRVRLFAPPLAGGNAFPRLQHTVAQLEPSGEETNFTLGLAELAGRLNQRSLIVLISEFVDTTTTELMIENVARLVRRHLVLFVTFRDPALRDAWDAEPQDIEGVARAVVADDFLRERQVVFERLRRLGVLILDTSAEMLSTDLVNRYLAIQRREMI
ncbi:MAG: DUF58 domain-containing protein [Alphaproteobacteria bacterium]|nr:DUF58 domain-containing protein [Alphaproteobacteria bacterium]